MEGLVVQARFCTARRLCGATQGRHQYRANLAGSRTLCVQRMKQISPNWLAEAKRRAGEVDLCVKYPCCIFYRLQPIYLPFPTARHLLEH